MPKKKKDEVGTCYVDSYRFLVDYPTDNGWPKLVHGTVFSPHFGERIKHAWIEFDSGYVLEAVKGYMFSPDKWKEIAKPRRLYLYTRKQAAELALKIGTYGPWEGHISTLPRR